MQVKILPTMEPMTKLNTVEQSGSGKGGRGERERFNEISSIHFGLV